MRFEAVPITDDDRRFAAENGAEGPWKLKAKLPDGELRVMWGREPFNDDGSKGLHVSISVGKRGQCGPFRRPTKGECWLVLKRFIIKYGVGFEEGNMPDGDPCIRHWWERKRQSDEPSI